MKLLITIAIVLVALFVGDILLRSVAQDQTEQMLISSLGLSAEPDVEFEGWPFVTQVFSGKLDAVTVRADGLTRRGLRLDDVEITLEQVHLGLGDLLTGEAGSVRVESGEGTARLGASALNDLLRRSGIDATAEIADGRVTVMSPSVPGEVVVEPVLRDGGLQLDGFDVDLPEIASGIDYSSVDVAGSYLVLELQLEGARLRVPPQGAAAVSSGAAVSAVVFGS